MTYRAATLFAALAAALTACSSNPSSVAVPSSTASITSSSASASAAPSAPAPAPAAPISDSDGTEFTRADTGAVLGTAVIVEVRRVPATCASDPVGAIAQLVAVHTTLSSAGTATLPRPDTTTLIPVDESGTTYEAAQATLTTACRSDYPKAGAPVPGGKTDGWTVVAVPVAATALRYYPIITEGATFVKPSPLFVAAPIPA